jgi:hypothetical protein
MIVINRRQFLKITGAGTTGLLTGGLPSLGVRDGARAASNPMGKFIPDLDIALKAIPAEMPILPGNPTGVWHYQGRFYCCRYSSSG